MPAVSSKTKQTSRLRMHYLEAGPEDGVPVVLIHGCWRKLYFDFLASVR